MRAAGVERPPAPGPPRLAQELSPAADHEVEGMGGGKRTGRWEGSAGSMVARWLVGQHFTFVVPNAQVNSLTPTGKVGAEEMKRMEDS